MIGPDRDPELFWATAGGMGLTGIVSELTLRLLPVETALMSVDTERATDLDDVMARMRRRRRRLPLLGSVDRLPGARRVPRTFGALPRRPRHARPAVAAAARARPPLQAPHAPHRPWVPDGSAEPLHHGARSTRSFFRKAPREERGRITHIAPFVHPLDWISGWNRIYGRRGFLQYQYVVPEHEDETVRHTLERLSDARCASFLAVLKRFGPGNPGMLSFPTSGWTLALDIPVGIRGLAPLLDELDELVAEAGGRVYLAKDSRLRPELLSTMYPRLDELQEVRARIDPSGVLQSDLARRLHLA